jgi:predicted GH43/DUF377 family glycosyl hydrolase
VHSFDRREFLLCAAGALPLRAEETVAVPARLRTPHKLGRLVLRGSGSSGSWDEKAVDCPFAFRHQDRFYMTMVGFDGTGYQTGLASSENLVDWKSEGAILRRDPSNPITRYNVALTWILRENDLASPGRLERVRGRFLGVYHAYPSPGYEAGPAVIGLCWSRDLRHWEVDPPCLRPEDGADWERGGLYKACILKHRGTFYIFYNAKTTAKRWQEQTGFASSTDLKRWTRHPGNPVIANGGPGSLDERFASDPCVVRDGDRWAIFYFSLDAKGVARERVALSTDLRTAVKCEGALIDVGPPGTVDAKYAHKPSVITHRGVLYHFYCAVSQDNVRGISVATSVPYAGTGETRAYREAQGVRLT